MQIIPIKTKKFLPPKDDLYTELRRLPKLKEGDILIITSKVLAIHQGRCIKIKKGDKTQKIRLAKQEAERYLKRNYGNGKYSFLTLIHNTLISSAGIDESNGNDYYILLPNNLKKLTKEIWNWLKKKFHLKKLGVVVIDSQSIPLRYGTMGISIGFFGIEPVIDIRGQRDLFDKPLKVTLINIVDALAVWANLMMGENKEQTPLAIIRGFKKIKFTNKDASRKLLISPKQDMYFPLLKVLKKR